jgi:hypothetical protein
MATIKEYYDSDFTTQMSVAESWPLCRQDSEESTDIEVKILLDFNSNAKFWSIYIPQSMHCIDLITYLLQYSLIHKCQISKETDKVHVHMGFSNYSEKMKTETMIFTKRIFIYVDKKLTVHVRAELKKIAYHNGLDLIIRDREYSMERSKFEKPLAFISHDSGDKDGFVRKLAIEMSKLMCPVWYDEFSLKVGDSLRENIEKVLKETHKCIVVLSPNFLGNEGWGKAEFDSIFTREILEKENVLLPIWHEVGVKEVYDYSPRLADKVGLSSKLGVEELAKRLVDVIKDT